VGIGVVIGLASVACGGGSSGGYGKAGDPAKASRVVDVHIRPTRQYEPAAITVKPGETVTFRVMNDDKTIHEFLLGDKKAQDAYEKEMKGMGTTPMKMADTANLRNIDPGQAEEITWAFPSKKGATVLYGSHEPGDYAGGLRGTITVS
jgi:uncharacterized cupredoxin-like copper-binding protein